MRDLSQEGGVAKDKLQRWNIWSTEHMAWWRPRAQGYTLYREEAGEYGTREARQILKSCHLGDESMIPVESSRYITHDLAMLVRHMASRLKANNLGGSLVPKALAYLKRHELEGSVLRREDFGRGRYET